MCAVVGAIRFKQVFIDLHVFNHIQCNAFSASRVYALPISYGFDIFVLTIPNMNLHDSINEDHSGRRKISTEPISYPSDGLINAALLCQRRHRLAQNLKAASERRSKRRELGWESVTDGSKYLIEYGTSASTSR